MTRPIPEPLQRALRPITVICGHYGVGKTNLAVNLAIDSAAEGVPTTLIDLDIVNPYFRASRVRGGGVQPRRAEPHRGHRAEARGRDG